MPRYRPKIGKRKVLRCTFCDSTDHVELHHPGGRKHVPWFTIPLCRKHHVQITRALRNAGVEMSHTPHMKERHKRAIQATLVFLWILLEES
jgi:hypothetical protein